jgi:phosphate transport system permease protein
MTAFIILLIVLFLFKEGVRFFNLTPVEKGNSLWVHRYNPVKQFSAAEVKDIFDRKITNWNVVGGADQPIQLLTIDELGKAFTEEQLGANFENIPACINWV